MRLTVKPSFSVEGLQPIASRRLTVAEGATISQVKCEVLTQFEWESVFGAEDITLSLNKKKSLGSGEELLSACGVCNGDVLWVLPPEGHKRVRAKMSKATAADHSTKPPTKSMEKVRRVSEERGNVSTSPLYTVSVILHGACIESGLEPLQQGVAKDVLIQSDSHSLYELLYSIPESSFLPQTTASNFPGEAAVKFVCTYLGEHVMICSFIQARGTDGKFSSTFGASANVHIPSHFVRTAAGSELISKKDLITELKSKACAPSMSSGAHALGRSLRLSVTSLPEEIIMHILSKLDLQELLSVCMTCRYLNALASSDTIWTHLYHKTFSRYVEERRMEGMNVKELFKVEWDNRKKERIFDRPFFVDRPHIFPQRPSVFIPFVPPQRGFLGGDADRLPFPPQAFGRALPFGDRRYPHSSNPPWPFP